MDQVAVLEVWAAPSGAGPLQQYDSVAVVPPNEVSRCLAQPLADLLIVMASFGGV